MDDLISRQAALEKVRAMQTYKLFKNDDMLFLVDKAEVQTELMMLPSVQPEVLACGNGELVAQPEPQWIPVGEKLPETEDFVLASLTGKYRNTTFEHACEIADYADGEWCVYAYPHMSAEKCAELIEAWMPLPEAYNPNKKTKW